MFADPKHILMQSKIGEGMKVADFGIGSGTYTLALAEAVGEHGVVYACDIQKELLSKIKKDTESKGLKNVHVVWGDLEEAGGATLADGLLDVVVLSNVLFQIEKKEILMHEAVRVLRGGGKVLIVDWKDSFGGTGPHADAVFGVHAARALAEKAGLTFEQDIDAGSHHYGMLLRKRR